MEKILFIAIIVFIIVEFLLSTWLEYLNNTTWSKPLPANVANLYDAEKYKKAAEYDQEKYKISLFSSILSVIITLSFILAGGFAWLDTLLRQYTQNEIILSLLFFGSMMFVSYLISLPFSIYSTFVIEEKYGFNKTTPKTFVLDTIKSTVLICIIGGALLSFIVWLQGISGSYFWLLAWATVSGFSIFMAMFYTSFLLPLFNKLTPLEDGPLKESIMAYANKVAFPVSNIQVMDGSKRSSKANAFFSGLGPKKSIVLFDTLINEMTQEEILAVLAHEVGHYKHKHIYKSMLISIVSTGIIFFIFGQIMNSDILGAVLGTPKSFHIALVVFSMLYSPISLITTPLMNLFSRKNEYEADAYAKESYDAEPLISGLKKMSINHLSNLQPHPYYVFFHYSHPPLSARVEALSAK
jgi:STE24 endopeptidase